MKLPLSDEELTQFALEHSSTEKVIDCSLI